MRLSDFAGMALFSCCLLLAGAGTIGYLDLAYRLERNEKTRKADAMDTREALTRLQNVEALSNSTYYQAESLRTWLREVDDSCKNQSRKKK